MAELPEFEKTEDELGYLNPGWRAKLRRAVPYDLRLRARRRVIETRGLSELVTRLDPRMFVTRITSETRAVMDGFPRSANTYAHLAFLYANGRDFPMCSHRHSHQSVLTGVRKGLPTIVLIREPASPIGSSLQYAPETKPSTAIGMYRAFYEGVLPVLDDILVATFDEVTGDFGEVIRRCNAKFGTDFAPYEKTEEAEAAIFSSIEDITSFAYGEDGLEEKVPRPSVQRSEADEIIAGFRSEDQAALREVEGLYRGVVELRTG